MSTHSPATASELEAVGPAHVATGLLPGLPRGADAAASGWRWPAARRWRASAQRRGARRGLRRQPRRHARDRGDHGPGAVRRARSPRRSAPRCSARWRRAACGPGCRSWPAPRVRVLTNADRRGLLHLGDRRRARRLRRHLRQRLAERFGFTLGRERHAGARRRRACSPGGRSRAGCRWASTGAGWRAGRRGAPAEPEPPRARRRRARGRFDPRAVALAAAIAFALLLSGTEWLLLGAVAAWLALAWLRVAPGQLGRAHRAGARRRAGGRRAVLHPGRRPGPGRGAEARARGRALLVAVATWLRAAAGAPGLREVSRRALGRLRRLPSRARGRAHARRDRLRGAPRGVRAGAAGRAPRRAAQPAADPRRRARLGGGPLGAVRAQRARAAAGAARCGCSTSCCVLAARARPPRRSASPSPARARRPAGCRRPPPAGGAPAARGRAPAG